MNRRKLSNEDANMGADIAIGTLKVGAMVLTWINGSPEAALSVGLVAEASGILLNRHRERIASLLGQLADKVHHLPAEMRDRFTANTEMDGGKESLKPLGPKLHPLSIQRM